MLCLIEGTIVKSHEFTFFQALRSELSLGLKLIIGKNSSMMLVCAFRPWLCVPCSVPCRSSKVSAEREPCLVRQTAWLQSAPKCRDRLADQIWAAPPESFGTVSRLPVAADGQAEAVSLPPQPQGSQSMPSLFSVTASAFHHQERVILVSSFSFPFTIACCQPENHQIMPSQSYSQCVGSVN